MSDPQPQTLFDNAPPEDSTADTSFLEGLNDRQLEAVTHADSHCLVLAGAGSGKTRVLTHRIAWLIAERAVEPDSICAVTFTNKAASEMRGRVRRLVGPRAGAVWLSTFHALGLRLLRDWSEAAAAGSAASVGLPGHFDATGVGPAHHAGPGAADWMPPAGFPVYNRDASLAVWRQSQAALRISPRDYDPGRQLSRCSRAVSRLEDPASWDADDHQSWGWEKKLAGRVWKQYRAAMRAAGAVDFDDLLVLPLQLLSRHRELRQRTAERFAHLLVDEYQDTNRIQYRLIRTLLAEGSELLVVGDEDQSIYRWRGADLDNVLDFQKDFPGAKVVRLEQNYRSTQPILSAAGSLVANNRQRLGKELWTDLDGGETPCFVQCATDREEAEWVADKIAAIREEDGAQGDGPELHAQGGGSEIHGQGSGPEPRSRRRRGSKLGDIAVLYRTNAQSRQFEETFIRRRIPHLVVGGQRFFARREVRDVLSWLQLLVRDDDVALRRAVGTPSRGIGAKTIASLAAVDEAAPAAATLRGLAAADDPAAAFAESGFSPAISERLTAFGRLLAELRAFAAKSSVADLIRATTERSGYAAFLDREENTEERLANIGELVTAAEEAARSTEEAGSSTGVLPGADGDHKPSSGALPSTDQEDDDGLAELRRFLDRLALLADADTDRADATGVRLMTVHAAKGLEFGVVFLAGMEEELFPHASSLADGDVEEERRLCYVGMTRARKRLLLTAARSRRINGRERWQEPSRFIGEIDPRCIEVRDWISPRAVGSKDYAPSSFTGLGGRTGQRQRARRGSRGRPGGARRKPASAKPVKYAGPTRPADEADLDEGAVVVHPMFGPGRITSTAGNGDRLKLDIRFDKAGSKTVVAKFAKLQVPA